MKVVFLDFDGVMDTAYYDFVLIRDRKPNRDTYGPIFDPNCVDYLRGIYLKNAKQHLPGINTNLLIPPPESHPTA